MYGIIYYLTRSIEEGNFEIEIVTTEFLLIHSLSESF